MLDVGIATWNAKAIQDTVRPISYIRWRYKGTKVKGWLGPGKGVGDLDGSSWIPYQEPGFVTAPSAEYTSGHSAFSGAASEVSTGFAGTDTFKTALLVMMPAGTSTVEPGLVPRDDTGSTAPPPEGSSCLQDSLGKGDRVVVTGRLRQRSWETPEGA